MSNHSPTIPVRLTPVECELAAGVGLRRAMTSWTRGDKDNHGYKGDPFRPHILGSIAEYCVAKGLRHHWPLSVDTFTREADVAANIEVRWSATGSLIIRPQDVERHPDWPYVLVTGTGLNYLIHGWLTPVEAQVVGAWRSPNNRPGAWFVDTPRLHPPTTLRCKV